MAKDASNTRDLARVALTYTPDCRWRNRVRDKLKLAIPQLEFRRGMMDQRGVLSALSPANYLPAILCGIVLLLSVGVGSAEDSPVPGKGQIDAKSFRCITEMTHVRQFYVDNLLGDLDATLAVANSATGGTYPPGSVIQLIPGEAMVKRDKGFNPVTHDWEFFELNVSKDGTEIRKRGFAEVVNRFGGNCFGCHIQARPQWDLVCEMDHGCAPIPVTRAMSGALQRTDPRCKIQTVSPEDAEALKQLNELLKPSDSNAKQD
jgi:hypothetical protein